jgi:circadian clock protein KaiC
MRREHALQSILRMPTGIAGFDEISDGGLPRGGVTVVLGGAGAGKTIFGIQVLAHGAREDHEPGILVAFEESADRIVANTASFVWGGEALNQQGVHVLDAQLSQSVEQGGDFDLLGLLAILGAKAKQVGARRIVFDGLDVLLSYLGDAALIRREAFRLREWVYQNGLTAILTAKAESAEACVSADYDFLQFMADCVVTMHHRVVHGTALRFVRVAKYRGAAHSANEVPLTITRVGIEVAANTATELAYPASTERISSGVERLDAMLGGGYYRGSSVLITGVPGTAKTSLAAAFAEAAARRGERTLYVSFDEGSSQIVRNLRSVGIHLSPHLKSGMLEIFSTRTRGPNIEDQFGDLRTKVRAFAPRCLVIDPLSALSTKLEHLASADAAQQFLDFLKGQGITVVNTSLMDGLSTDEATATGISTIADTWIHVSYVVQDGERNRALTIVKSRGTGHSNQVRELTLADDGVTLTDVFVAQGKVLMGVARWEWEQEEQAKKKAALVAAELKRLQLQLTQAEAAARLQVVQTEMEARSAEIALLALATGSASKLLVTDRAVLRKMRHADEEIRDTRPRAANDVAPVNGGKGAH